MIERQITILILLPCPSFTIPFTALHTMQLCTLWVQVDVAVSPIPHGEKRKNSNRETKMETILPLQLVDIEERMKEAYHLGFRQLIWQILRILKYLDYTRDVWWGSDRCKNYVKRDNWVPFKIEQHQWSSFSRFVLIMNNLIAKGQGEIHWYMLFVDGMMLT